MAIGAKFFVSRKQTKWTSNVTPDPGTENPPPQTVTLMLSPPVTQTGDASVLITCYVQASAAVSENLAIYCRAVYSTGSISNVTVTIAANSSQGVLTITAARLLDADRTVTLSILENPAIYNLGEPVSHNVDVPQQDQVENPPPPEVTVRTSAYNWDAIQAGTTDTEAIASLWSRTPKTKTKYRIRSKPTTTVHHYWNGSSYAPIKNEDGSNFSSTWPYQNMRASEASRTAYSTATYFGRWFDTFNGDDEYMRANSGWPGKSHDGKFNPEMQSIDGSGAIGDFFEDIKYLGLSYYYKTGTDKTTALNKLVEFTDWFLTSPEGMLPELYFGQVVPADKEGFGRGTGYVGFEGLSTAIDGWLLTRDAMPTANRLALDNWIREFWLWSTNQPNARTAIQTAKEKSHQTRIIGEAGGGVNNVSMAYKSIIYTMGMYLGETEWVRNEINADMPGNLATAFTMSTSTSINKSGRIGAQLAELRRSRPWTYSIKGYQIWLQLANIAESVGIDLWNMKGTNGVTLKDGARWMMYYAANPSAFHALYPITTSNTDISKLPSLDDARMVSAFADYKWGATDSQLAAWCDTYDAAAAAAGASSAAWLRLYTPAR